MSRTRRILRGVLSLVVLTLLHVPVDPPGVASASTASTWDAEADFQSGWSSGLNPNGQWSYGWSAGLHGPVTLFTQQLAPAMVNNHQELMWVDPANNFLFAPSVARSPGDAFDDGNVDFDAGALILTHGRDGQYAHVTWTAPADGTYTVESRFKGQQHSIDTDVHVLVRGVAVFDSVIAVDRQVRDFGTELALKAGDSVDFSVGPDGLSYLHGGNTRLQARIVASRCALAPGPGDIVGTAGDDQLLGTPGKDRIFGLGGDDRIDGAGGDDTIVGGPGLDRISGGDGNDTACGGDGPDLMSGGAGNDALYGDAGDDDLAGGVGNDQLDGGAGVNRTDGGAGSDSCLNATAVTNCAP